MSDLHTPQSTQTPPQAGNSNLGNIFLNIMKGSAAVAVGAGVAAVAPVAIGAAAVLGTATYAAYTVANAIRHPSTPQRAADEDEPDEASTVEDENIPAREGKHDPASNDKPDEVSHADGGHTGPPEGKDQPQQQAANEHKTEAADKTVETESLAAKQEAEAKPLATEHEAAKQEAEAQRLAAEQEAAKQQQETNRLEAEQAEARRAADAKAAEEQAEAQRVAAAKAAEKAAAEKAAAEKREQDRLGKLAAGLLQQVNGQKKAPDSRASVDEAEAPERKRQAIRDLLEATPLTEGAIKEAERELGTLDRMLGDLKAQITERVRQQKEADQQRRAEEAAAAGREQQRKADAAAALAAEAWRKTADEAEAVLASVTGTLSGMADVLKAYNGMEAGVVHDKDLLAEMLAAGETATPNETARKSIEQRTQNLKDWAASIAGAYDPEMAANLKSVLQSKAKTFAKERDQLVTKLVATNSTAGDISGAYAKMIAKEGPWTPEAERKPVKQPKQRPTKIDVEPVGLGNLMSVLPQCVAPIEITWKSEGNGAKRNSFYKYANGVEIHVHRNGVGKAVKAHAKLSANKLTMGTAQDNDIPPANLAAHGIDQTEVPRKGKEVQ